MRKKTQPKSIYPIVFETYRSIGYSEMRNLKQEDPSSFNGFIRIKKYKVTIEEVIEPQEVYEKRLQELWDNCDNHHHWTPIQNCAKEIEYELKGDFGSKKKIKTNN